MAQRLFFVICVLCVSAISCSVLEKLFKATTEDPEAWTGRWLPERFPPTTSQPPTNDDGNTRAMGNKDECDDGKTNLWRDWNGDHSAYLCMNPRRGLISDLDARPVMEFENIPKAYEAAHLCMNESITYTSTEPTFGTHRQLWPIYGDYKFLPAQRWLHTLEHGGIVALYHPCADRNEVNLLKKSVRGCLRRHVITPWPYLTEQMPFAVMAWGVRLRMPVVDPNLIMGFIQVHALQGPERVSREGQFKEMLLTRADVVSDIEDSKLCPIVLAHD